MAGVMAALALAASVSGTESRHQCQERERQVERSQKDKSHGRKIRPLPLCQLSSP